MNRSSLRASLIVAFASLLTVFVAACGSGDDSAPAGAAAVAVKLTDAGCDPHNLRVPAGPITIEAENAGSSSVTEIEVLDGETILGEKEDLTDGLSGSFSLTLEAGHYILRCNNGEQEDGTLTVGGS
jgi:iron uptake system component EfeO